MVITEEIIEQGRSRNGGWSMQQLECFDIKSFHKGWKRGLIGKVFPGGKVELFLRLKDKHLKTPKIENGTIKLL